MKNFIKVNGFDCVVYLALLALVQIIGLAMFGLGFYGWFQGDCDIAAALGMGIGFLVLLFGTIQFGEAKEKAKERVRNEKE